MRIFDYIFAARPMLHLPVWSIYLVSLHYHQQLSNDKFHWTDLIMLIALSLMASAAYYINQIHDYESDLFNKKLGFLQNGLLNEKKMAASFLIISLISLLIALFFSIIILAIFLQLFVLGYLYSVPPFRLKDRPLVGLFANAYGFGFLISFTVMPDIYVHNIGLLGWDNPFYFFFTVASIYVLTTLPDRQGDRVTGKRTLGVLLPRKASLLLAFGLMLLSAYIAYQSHYYLLVYLSLIASLAILMTLFINSPKLELFVIKLPILLLTLFAGYFFWGYLLFIVALLFASRIYYKKRFNIVYPKLA